MVEFLKKLAGEPERLSGYGALALLLAWAVAGVIAVLAHADLPFVLHLPLMGLALGLFGVGAGLGGILLAERDIALLRQRKS